jgi:hypothetical protein
VALFALGLEDGGDVFGERHLFDRLAGGFGGWFAGDQNTGC